MKTRTQLFVLTLILLSFWMQTSCSEDVIAIEDAQLEQENLKFKAIEDENDDDDDDDDDDDTSIKHPSLFFVQLPADIQENEVDQLLQELNAVEVWYMEEINLRLWNTSTFPYKDAQGQQVTNIDGQIARARSRPKVEEANFNLGANITDPQYTNAQYCFDNTFNAAAGSTEVKISIFDTGIDSNNPLSSQVSGYDYLENDEIPNDLNGHGTEVALLINSFIDLAGEVPNVSLDIRKTHDANGVGYFSALIPAIVDAVDEEVDIMNFSFSYKDLNENTANRPLRLAVDYAEANGVLMVAAAGNNGVNNDYGEIVSFPASYPNSNIMAVASLDCNNQLASFSSYGNATVDVAFLGENLPVFGISGAANKSGTSYTTALVTAMSALLASHQTEMNATQIKCALIENSVYSPYLSSILVSQGVINFDAAFQNIGICN